MTYIAFTLFFPKFAVSSRKITLNHVKMRMRCRIYGPRWEASGSSPHTYHQISTLGINLQQYCFNSAQEWTKSICTTKKIKTWLYLLELHSIKKFDGLRQIQKIRSLRQKKFRGQHQVLEAHFSQLSIWTMVKSISVQCFIKNLSTSNNSSRQARWNPGQKESWLPPLHH